MTIQANLSTTSNRRERAIAWLLAAILLVANIYIFPRWSDPNQNSRLDMIFAVVDQGTFQIDHYVANTVDYARVGEHTYSDKAPGTAFLGIPVYAAVHWFFDTPLFGQVVTRLSNNQAFQETLRVGGSGILDEKVRFALLQVLLTWLLAALPTALMGVLLFNLLRSWLPAPGARAAIVLAYSLLTPAFAYSQSFYGHQLAAALLVACLWLLLRKAGKTSWPALFVAGFMAGFAVITEYPAAVVAAPILLYGAFQLIQQRRWTALVPLVVGTAIPLAGWMAYNTAVFGGPLSLGYSYSELWTRQHHTGFMSLTYPSLEAAWGITFSDFRGLFFIAPILLTAIPGYIAWWQSREGRSLFWVSLTGVILVFIFNASSIMWWGGFSIGPRYLLPGIPLLVFPMTFFWRRWGRTVWVRIGTALLAVWSLGMTWGLTLAEQAFPSDTIRHPFVEFALPNWLDGNIARNLGTVLGLSSVLSLIPLVILLGAGVALLIYESRGGKTSKSPVPVGKPG